MTEAERKRLAELARLTEYEKTIKLALRRGRGHGHRENVLLLVLADRIGRRALGFPGRSDFEYVKRDDLMIAAIMSKADIDEALANLENADIVHRDGDDYALIEDDPDEIRAAHAARASARVGRATSTKARSKPKPKPKPKADD